jgi:hypothetical protein
MYEVSIAEIENLPSDCAVVTQGREMMPPSIQLALLVMRRKYGCDIGGKLVSISSPLRISGAR